MRVPAVVLLGALCAGCASSSADVTAAYVSPYQYENLTCPQLADEAGRVSQRAAELAGVQDQKRTKDAVATGVAAVVFWPALFFVGGNNQTTAELSQMRGQMQALEQVSDRKKCGIRFQRGA